MGNTPPPPPPAPKSPPPCSSGYHRTAVCTCEKDACDVGGYIVTGLADRTSSCSPGYEMNAGLCYKQCNAGYTGVATICRQDGDSMPSRISVIGTVPVYSCPSNTTNYGAFCVNN